ncbi:Cytochrome c biogenesis protein ResB [Pseudomonas syringae pv. actinidiae]|uniref:Cytochrome c biogenesis protein ResB n=1 Tax=Pseudomonas syringae pv. actinidiae TaxID=103796 RepID=A0A2V0Q5T0_PSESF|nr:Cytochrome c biogenesis protein ResB [Pseudomonas syringae pv. actinidiae]
MCALLGRQVTEWCGKCAQGRGATSGVHGYLQKSSPEGPELSCLSMGTIPLKQASYPSLSEHSLARD